MGSSADGGGPAPERVAALEPVEPLRTDGARAAGGRRSGPSARRPSTVLLVTAAAVGAAFAGPLLYVVAQNVALGSDVWAELTSADTWRALGRTLVLALAVSASGAVLGTGLAWLTTRTDLPGRRLWRVLVPLPLVVPSFVGAAALLAALAPGGLLAQVLGPVGVEELPALRGFTGAWLVLTLFTYPYVYLPAAARFALLPPSLEESARLLGRRPRQVFTSVVLPQSRGAVLAGTLLVFLYTVSDFGAVKLLRYPTLTTQIFANRLFDRPQAFALALLLAAVALAVVAAERGVARRSAAVEAVGGGRPLLVPLGRWRAPATGGVALVLLLALVGPLATLAYWAGRGLSRSGAAATSAGLGELVAPTVNTAVIGTITAVVAVVVVLPVAFLTARHRTRTGAVANTLVVGGFALPGLVVALALVFWVLNAPVLGVLYQTLPVLIFAYVVHFGAQSMRAAQVAVSGVPDRLGDAARVLGAGPARRLATVELPLMLPGLVAGAGLVLLSTMKELPATLLLRPTDVETLSVHIWNAAEDGFLAELGLASIVLVALSGVLTWLLVVRRAHAA